MATQKKPTGLGRGLDELLEDNTLSKRTSKPLVESRGEVKTQTQNTSVNTAIYGSTQKELYQSRPKTRSLKSNFKNNGR